MTTASTGRRRMLYAAIGLVIAAAPAAAAFGATPAPRVSAQCQDSDTEDSFSMNCAPTVIPDTSDQLTEAEVAEPGFNGGGTHSSGGGGGGGHR
ncbi:hypothetical protein FHT40_001022 [Mycolicibacterium sp. BK556]|uniref:hypothetical protein n=1 Tax=Mycobacteriaceae TaxID=1762 RepID=UPI00105C5837|nr:MULTISPECIES: hypothetical protein [Mycobacteriaceae]MBB3601389.1 hypothetical protein [Mycolicibacterium sp. BK556]MBB3631141.1 hypothetical protein [Mycolicibacterium sp. BK607]MBB3749143.1 hypothetical protein [Mycolicibacterium sp. BK634]TDO14646.1 hypothetical protein EV580_2779 [Mycobacterium sp. BK086]